MKNRLHIFLYLLSASLLGMQVTAFAATETDAQQLIIDRSGELVDALKEQQAAIKSDPQIAYKLVEDIVLPHVDFNRVARLVLGKYWRQANDEQRERFTKEFRDFLVRTYVTAMIEFSDQIVSHAKNVKYLPFRNSDPNDVSVRMQITLPDRPPMQINYSLYQDENGWKIYDLALEGLSLATTYRSSFSTQIRREGIDGLINKLAERNASAAPQPAESTTN